MSNSKYNNGRPKHDSFMEKLRKFVSLGRPNDDANKKKERDFQKKYYLRYLEYQKSTDGYQDPEQK